MTSRPHSFLVNLLALAVIAVAFFVVLHSGRLSVIEHSGANNPQTAAAVVPPAASSSAPTGTTGTSAVATGTHASPTKARVAKASRPKSKVIASSPAADTAAVPAQTPPVFEITRVQNPYSTPPRSFDEVNVEARAALVNILCMPQGGASLQPISGSGVIIDPRGVILTNAHVAQYVLLSESPRINLSCVIRTGSPATPKWTAEVLFIPPVWVAAHAAEINSPHPMGTGEHDWALLRITGSVDGSPQPPALPALSFDTREVIGFPGDQVLGAAYPAEFVGGLNAQNNLNAVSSVSPIAQLLTFGAKTVDTISIGGVIEAQEGSSGGAVVNAWQKLIALITTTSEGETTAQRQLRAIMMSHIDRDITAQTGQNLAAFLQGDLAGKTAAFTSQTAPGLVEQYIKVLAR